MINYWIARPLGLHYNHYVSSFARPLSVIENVHASWTHHILHTYACQHSLAIGMQ